MATKKTTRPAAPTRDDFFATLKKVVGKKPESKGSKHRRVFAVGIAPAVFVQVEL